MKWLMMIHFKATFILFLVDLIHVPMIGHFMENCFIMIVIVISSKTV